MSRAAALAILRLNVGFTEPERWVEVAIRKQFQRTDAIPVPNCPDCGGPPASTLGQYIYYSTLIHLRECACGLIWADARLDHATVSAHFERAYKSREYFLQDRTRIFQNLAGTIDRHTPLGGRVLDLGGAQGDLLHELVQRRPDIIGVLHDLSSDAVQFGIEQFGFRGIIGGLEALESLTERFDTVVLSDVLYYQPRIAAFWDLLPRLVAPHGAVILRVPNKLWLVRLRQRFNRNPLQVRVKHVNNEHVTILSRRYLTRRLEGLGFRVQVLPSPALRSNRPGLVAWWLSRLTGRVLSGGMVIVGTR